MKKLIIFILMMFVSSLLAGDIFRIEIGQDYKNYSDSDLKRRVWELERAVFQLQQKVFEIESVKSKAVSIDTWLCKVESMGETFTGIGGSKAVAENFAMEKCKDSPRSSNGFHCGTAKCSQ